METYDYSSGGAYFITICTWERKCLLSHIDGSSTPVLTEYGEVLKENLLKLPERFPHMTVDRYVIMPNHTHIILLLDYVEAGASPRPTIMDAVCVLKSLTTRGCKKIRLFYKLFQTSFYEHVIRNQVDYEMIAAYIDSNPMQWKKDRLYTIAPTRTDFE